MFQKSVFMAVAASLLLGWSAESADWRRGGGGGRGQGGGGHGGGGGPQQSEVVLKDGSALVRIEIGDEAPEYGMRRLKRLEQAVAQLQRRVFQLEMEGRYEQNSWTCTATSVFGRVYFATAEKRGVAEANARKQCVDRESFAQNCHQMSCTDQ